MKRSGNGFVGSYSPEERAISTDDSPEAVSHGFSTESSIHELGMGPTADGTPIKTYLAEE